MRRSVSVVMLVACALVGTAACGSSKPKVVAPPVPVDMRGKPAVEIIANGNQFTPVHVIVDIGTKVTWNNTDPIAHNVKKSSDSLDFGGSFGTDLLSPAQTYSFTFKKAGTFFYTCTIHTAMSGQVEVVAKK